MAKLCALKCVDPKTRLPRYLPENSAEEICPCCRRGIQKDSLLSLAELKFKQMIYAGRQRRIIEIRGADGTGPRPGGYVARLQVKRRARARAEKQRKNQPAKPPKHYPAHQSAQ